MACCREANCRHDRGKGSISRPNAFDGDGSPKVGDRIWATALGFLSYRLRFILEAVELTSRSRVVVTTSGDFDGRWTATLSQRGDNVHVGLVWVVTAMRPILKFLAPIFRPAFAWTSRWTTPRGEAGLRRFFVELKNEKRACLPKGCGLQGKGHSSSRNCHDQILERLQSRRHERRHICPSWRRPGRGALSRRAERAHLQLGDQRKRSVGRTGLTKPPDLGAVRYCFPARNGPRERLAGLSLFFHYAQIDGL